MRPQRRETVMNTYVPLNIKHPMTQRLSDELIAAGAWINQRGWCPATGGNFSARIAPQGRVSADLDPDLSFNLSSDSSSDSNSELSSSELYDPCCLVTASGVHKGALTEDDLLEVDWDVNLSRLISRLAPQLRRSSTSLCTASPLRSARCSTHIRCPTRS